jgi:hypothetical protein
MPARCVGRNSQHYRGLAGELVALPGLGRAKLDFANVTAKKKSCKETAKNSAFEIFPSTMAKLGGDFSSVVGINRHTEIHQRHDWEHE